MSFKRKRKRLLEGTLYSQRDPSLQDEQLAPKMTADLSPLLQIQDEKLKS